jgi:hypothetical protein
MANEMKLYTGLVVTKGEIRENDVPRQIQVTMNGTGWSGGVQAIGTSTHVAVAFGANLSTNVGFGMLVNLSTSTSTSDYIQLGLDVSGTFYQFEKLRPTHRHELQLGTKDIYAKAFGASQNLQHKFYDE